MKILLRDGSSNFHFKLVIPSGLIFNGLTASMIYGIAEKSGKFDMLSDAESAGSNPEWSKTAEDGADARNNDIDFTDDSEENADERLEPADEGGIICIDDDEEKQITKKQFKSLMRTIQKVRKLHPGLPLVEIESSDGDLIRIEL